MTDEEEAKQVISDVIDTCIEADGVFVTQVTGLGNIITEHPLNESEQKMLGEFAEALRVKRDST